MAAFGDNRRTDHGSNRAVLCGPDCRYRSLYEGSQHSLSDMGAKQAHAHAQHHELKSELVQIMKQYFRDDFDRAERDMRQRMSEKSDEVLVAYLRAWVQKTVTAAPTATAEAVTDPGLDVLRTELRRVGVPVPDSDDLTAWSAVVAETPLSRTGTVVHHDVPRPPAPSKAALLGPDPGDSLSDLFDDVDDWEPARTAPGDDAPLRAEPPADDFDDLDDLFASLETSPSPEPVPVDGRDLDDRDLDDLFADFDNEPAQADGSGAVPTCDVAVPGAADDLEDLFASVTDGPGDVAGSDADGSDFTGSDIGDDAGFADLFADEPSPGPDVPLASAPGSAGDLDDLFADEATASEPAAAGSLDDLFADFAEPGTEPAADAEPTVDLTGGGFADLFAAADPAVPSAPAPRTEPTAPTVPDAVLFMNPLRPEQLPKSAKRRRRGGKTPRTRAAAADPAMDVPDQPTNGHVDLEAEVRAALEAAVAIPRPVFSADLASIAGSRDAVDAWESEMRDLRSKSPVRFIAPKNRHRSRGTLIVPKDDLRAVAAEFNRSWWSEAIDEYRGADLYELAVLMHRVGDQIISHQFTSTCATLRLNSNRGVTGMVVAFKADDTLEPAVWEPMLDGLVDLSRDRLANITVLSTRVDNRIRDLLVEHLPAWINERGFSPLAPILYATSYEWANHPGASTTLLWGN